MPTKIAALLAVFALTMPLAAEEDAGMGTVAKGNNELAVDLYQKLRTEDGNLFLSPYSITSALAMCYAGAKGNTEAEMAKALRFSLPQDALHAAMGALTKDLNGRVYEGKWEKDPDKGRKPFELVVANALWGQTGYPFRKEYLDLVGKAYDAGLTELDFQKDTEGARQTINAWVEKKTNDRIKDLIARGMLAPDARLVLTNAIYFKAAWAEAFRKEATKDEDFHLAGGEAAKVPMMHGTHRYRYLDGDGFQAIEIPYLGEQATMVVLVPREAGGLPALEAKLTAADLDAWLGGMKREQIALGLPRFKTECAFLLNAQLQALGMKDAFGYPAADFTGMSETKELYIGLVIHKSFVDVNEEGTEAAAATAIVMRAGGMPAEPRSLTIDRPFLYLIRDAKTGAILFLGRIVDPRA